MKFFLAYSRFICRYPIFVSGASFLACTLLPLITLFVTELPDFSEPLTGFITTNTEISNHMMAFRGLQNDLWSDGIFTQKVDMFMKPELREDSATRAVRQLGMGVRKQHLKQPQEESAVEKRKKKKCLKGPGLFCDQIPPHENGHLVFQVKDLFSLASFKSLCRFQRLLGDNDSGSLKIVTRDTCDRHSSKVCCQPWHVASVAANLLGKSNCSQLTSDDIDIFLNMVRSCLPMADKILACWPKETRQFCLPDLKNCSSIHYFILFNYLLDKDFMTAAADINKTFSTTDLTLKTVMVLPVMSRFFEDDYFSKNHLQELMDAASEIFPNDVEPLYAVELGYHDVYFRTALFCDLLLALVAGCLILLVMWYYTSSFFFTLAAVTSIYLAVALAYFCYRTLYDISFFPFMNLLTVVLMIGIGADDTFIFRHAWIQAKKASPAAPMESILCESLSHSAVVMFVTSFTTAVAFCTNVVSHIKVIKCFGLFAGTAVICNYLTVVTWLPAATVVIENAGQCLKHKSWFSSSDSSKQKVPARLPIWSKIISIYQQTLVWLQRGEDSLSEFLFRWLLPKIVVKLHWYLLVGLGSLSVYAAMSVFWYPGLGLPQRKFVQFLRTDHPYERWSAGLKENFAFANSTTNCMPMITRVVWGVEPDTREEPFNPYENPKFVLSPNNTFDMTDDVALLWMMRFCSRLMVHNLTNRMQMPLVVSCFVQDFMQQLKLRCPPRSESTDPNDAAAAADANQDDDDDDAQSNASCQRCCECHPPYPPGVVDKCLKKLFAENRAFLEVYSAGLPMPTGPLFLKSTGRLAAMVATFLSTECFTFVYEDIDRYYTTMNTWITKEVNAAPLSVRGGWFISDQLEMYDLQKALLSGTRISVAASLTLATLVIFVTTTNLLVSLFAIVTITCIVLVIVGFLVALQWELSVVESMIIILAIGLSFDFTLHYAVAVLLYASAEGRCLVEVTMLKSGSPVFMAMLTTLIAGLTVLPCNVYAYVQIGLFMTAMTIISWTYATLFFMSLVHLFARYVPRFQYDLPKLSDVYAALPDLLKRDNNKNKRDVVVATANHVVTVEGNALLNK